MPSPLLPTLAETVARARVDLRIGLPVVIGDQVIAAVETLTESRLAALRAMGEPVLALTERRASTLKLAAYDRDLVRLALPPGSGLYWLKAVADPALDLEQPLKGPFSAVRGGDPAPARAALGLAKAAQLLPAVVAVPAPAGDTGDLAGLVRLDPARLAEQLAAETLLRPVAAAGVPLALAGPSRLHVLRPESGGAEHYAVEIGTPDRDGPVLTRLHSACFTGDVLGSLKCDCGPQLHAALAAMGREGAGVLLYLNQEGRGIGLANKMRAYALQAQGFDTVEANHRLGFEDDERDFRLGAAMLRQLGIGRVRLMTNNPRKVEMLGRRGIAVEERVPLIVPAGPQNRGYLATKAAKSGHLL